MAKQAEGCGTVWAGLLNVALEGPAYPVEAVEEAPAAKPPAPEAQAPCYEYHIEPIVYLVGHGMCLLLSLCVLWLLFQSAMGVQQLITAMVLWIGLGYCSFRLINGVRYGCDLKVYKGFLEYRAQGPTRVITSGEVAHFRESNRYGRTRRITLYLKSGERIRLPRVHNPDRLWRSLLDDVKIEQVIA